MNIGVVGCGSIGRRHINNLLHIGGISIFACDPSKKAVEALRSVEKIEFFDSVQSMLEATTLDAVFVCTPTNLHVEHVMLALQANAHVFVEKPLSHSLHKLDELAELAAEKDRMVFVACNMRFHDSVRRIRSIIEEERIGRVLFVRAEYGHYLPNWRPSTDYTETYSANRSQGGGILLDAIHEFDYLSWMFGAPSEVFCFSEKLGDLDIDVEDTAEVLIRFGDSVLAEVHVDYLQRCKRRSCQVVGTEGTVMLTSTGKIPEESEFGYYDAKSGSWEVYRDTIESNDAYLEQIVHFCRSLRSEEAPISDLESGIGSLKVVLSAKASARSGRVVKLARGIDSGW